MMFELARLAAALLGGVILAAIAAATHHARQEPSDRAQKTWNRRSVSISHLVQKPHRASRNDRRPRRRRTRRARRRSPSSFGA